MHIYLEYFYIYIYICTVGDRGVEEGGETKWKDGQRSLRNSYKYLGALSLNLHNRGSPYKLALTLKP